MLEMGSAVAVGVAFMVVAVAPKIVVLVAAGGFAVAVALGATWAVAVTVVEVVDAGCAMVSRLLYVFSTSSPGMDEK